MARLKTLEADLAAPRSRIGNAGDAYNYAFGLIEADDRRALFRSYVKGNIDGNAPYRTTARDKTNLNFRQGAALINQFKVPYYDLIAEVPLLFEIETAFGRSEERSEWSQIISEEFHRMLTNWEDWDFVIQFSQYQMLVYGIGAMFWHDGIDWRPDVARIGEILVEDQAPSRLSELEAVVIRKAWKPTELMRKIQDEGKAKAVGWNPKAVKMAVRDSYTGSDYPPDQSSTYEWVQQKYKNADIYYGNACERVWTANILNVEFPVGEDAPRVSHHIVRTDQQVSEFLYSKIGAFDSLGEMIAPFFYDIGDGTWHSIRGLGTEIFPYCQIFNKLRCREVDAAMIAASVLVQAKDGNAAQAAQMLTLDNLKIIPEGVNFLEHAIGQNLQGTIDVRRDMEQGMNQNIGSLQKAPGQANPRKGQKLGILEMQQAAQLGKGNINRWYTSFDRFGKVTFAKAANPALRPYHPGATEALEFQRRCRVRGVPPEALTEIDSIKAYRSIGAGSAANAIMITDALMELAPSLQEPGRQALFRLYISRLAGTRTADMLVGDVDEGAKKTDQDWQASVENQELRRGANGKDFFQTNQNHVIHARSHITDMAVHLNEVEQVAAQRSLEIEDLQPLYTHLEAAGPHAYDHLQQLKGDKIREKDYKELMGQWNDISKMADQVKHNLDEMMQERQQQAQEQQPQVNDELLKQIPYKNAPEGTKMRIEALAGVPREQGDLSTDAQNLEVKKANLELKASRQKEQSAIADVQTAQSIESHRKDMAEPPPSQSPVKAPKKKK